LYLASRLRVEDLSGAMRLSGVDMIDDPKAGFRPAHAAAGIAQTGECLGARVFVENMAIDVEQHVPGVELAHDVALRNLLVESRRLHTVSEGQASRSDGIPLDTLR